MIKDIQGVVYILVGIIAIGVSFSAAKEAIRQYRTQRFSPPFMITAGIAIAWFGEAMVRAYFTAYGVFSVVPEWSLFPVAAVLTIMVGGVLHLITFKEDWKIWLGVGLAVALSTVFLLGG